jgi:RTX calcium-binding nonapeptide repeat (4 copies)
MGKARLAAAAVLATAALAGAAPAADAAPGCTVADGVLTIAGFRIAAVMGQDAFIYANDMQPGSTLACQTPTSEVTSILVDPGSMFNPQLYLYADPQITRPDGTPIRIEFRMQPFDYAVFYAVASPWLPATSDHWVIGETGADLHGDATPEVTFSGASPHQVMAFTYGAGGAGYSAYVSLRGSAQTGGPSTALLDFVGGAGPETVIGSSGDDFMNGEGGDDHLSGGKGNDEIWGGAGHDVLLGGAGDDLFQSGDGARDRVKGGSGSDSMTTVDCGIDVLRAIEQGAC